MIDKRYSIQWSETDIETGLSYSYLYGIYKNKETANEQIKKLEKELDERYVNSDGIKLIINIIPIEVEE